MKQSYIFTTLIAAVAAAPSISGPATLKRRADGVRTTVNIGKSTISYGTVDPKVALQQLEQACPPIGTCDQTPILVPTSLGLDDGTLEIRATGSYSSEAERRNFIDAIISTLSVGTVSRTEKVCSAPINNQQVVCNDVTVYSQTGYVGIQRFDGENSQGFMTATMSLKVEDEQWCDVIVDLFDKIAEAISGIGTGFFGDLNRITNLCGTISQ